MVTDSATVDHSAAEFAEKTSLAENPPEKNAASRKSAEKVCQPAEYNKKIRLVGLRNGHNGEPIGNYHRSF